MESGPSRNQSLDWVVIALVSSVLVVQSVVLAVAIAILFQD